MKRFLLLFLILSAFLPVSAFQTDSLQVSLLTVMPRSNEVYTIYGHTALRVYDPAQKINTVFNWGTFDFEAPHFLYRFIKGETDYFLSYTTYEHFMYAYSMVNASVVEQVLDLTPEGKEKLLQMLTLNMQPENLVYRYDFLFDNCTTRVRDLIEHCSDGILVYPEQTKSITFRQLIHSCTEPYPWMTFGIDLLIGSGADSLISLRHTLFLPVELNNALEGERCTVNGARCKALYRVPFTVYCAPCTIGIVLFVFYIIIAVCGRLKKRLFSGFFAPLFLIAGAAGCLIAFITLFSCHPCTSPNWNLLWLHPLHFIAFAGCFKRLQTTRLITWYHAINFVILSGLLLGWHWVPQTLNPADIPYILCLAFASGWIIMSKRVNKK
jgi:hypothetical protein